MPKVRMPAVAGAFYPGQAQTLAREIQKYLDNVPAQKISGEIKCLISPHAGYMYSGQVAAYAYKTLIGKNFDAVVVLAPSHRTHFEGASVFDGDFYRTPLGDVPIEKNIGAALLKSSEYFGFNEQADLFEHSLEVQVPFLQTVLKDFKIVPIIIGHFNRVAAETIAASIFEASKGKKILVVASSDMSHYHSAQTAETMDSLALKAIEKGNLKELIGLESSGESEMCGIGPVLIMMLYAEKIGARKIKILNYSHSGKVTGDNSGVVGYGAVAFGD